MRNSPGRNVGMKLKPAPGNRHVVLFFQPDQAAAFGNVAKGSDKIGVQQDFETHSFSSKQGFGVTKRP
jgi:hypothetical protein